MVITTSSQLSLFEYSLYNREYFGGLKWMKLFELQKVFKIEASYAEILKQVLIVNLEMKLSRLEQQIKKNL